MARWTLGLLGGSAAARDGRAGRPCLGAAVRSRGEQGRSASLAARSAGSVCARESREERGN
jgi:hypothetical protein